MSDPKINLDVVAVAHELTARDVIALVALHAILAGNVMDGPAPVVPWAAAYQIADEMLKAREP